MNCFLVPKAGIEPARSRLHRFLRPTRLPIPPPRHKGKRSSHYATACWFAQVVLGRNSIQKDSGYATVSYMQTPDLSFLVALADEADLISSHYFRQRDLSVQSKADFSPVSEADLEIETKIRQFCETSFPDLGIVGEEFGGRCDASRVQLIVDPIDATRNFVRGLPFFATLLALSVGGEIVASVVSAPVLQSRWVASLGAGSLLNRDPIYVSKINMLATSQCFHGSLFGNEAGTLPIEPVLKLLSSTSRQRGVGDFYGHMLVAMGCGEFCVDFGLKPWDIAALKLIVEEAGGKATNSDGGFSLEKDSLICSNGLVHSQVLDFLQ